MCHFVTLPVRMALFIGFGDQNQVAAGGVVVDWVEFVVLFNDSSSLSAIKSSPSIICYIEKNDF